jgi:hypothetical protein
MISGRYSRGREIAASITKIKCRFGLIVIVVERSKPHTAGLKNNQVVRVSNCAECVIDLIALSIYRFWRTV